MPTCETPIPNMFMSGDWVISHHGSFSQGEDHFMTKPFFSQLLSLSSVRLSIVYEAFFCYIIVFVVGSFVDCIYVTVTSHPSRGVCKAKHPRGSRVVYPLVSLEVATPLFFCIRSKSAVRKKVRKRCRSPPHKWFLIGCTSRFMRVAENLLAPRAWCKRCLFLVVENPTCSVPAL